MIVADIFERAKGILGACTTEEVFEYISDAIEVLSHKGEFDPLSAYIDIPTTNGNEVALPDFVEDIIKVNINRKPAFARGRLFEFRQNTDGTVLGDELGYTWADRGDRPVQVEPPTALFQLQVSEAGSMRVYGLDQNNQPIYTNGEEGYEPTINPGVGPYFAKITAVKKFKTTNYVTLWSVANSVGTSLANYEPRDYEPAFRVIKVSKTAQAVRLLVRRKTYAVNSMNDWIPLDSRIAITYMVKSLYLGRRTGGDPKEAIHFEKEATKYLQEAQSSRTVHSRVSDETELVTVRNQTYETSDMISVGDIYDQASEIFGPVGREKLLDRISDSVSMLANESNWDGLTAWMDISRAEILERGGCTFTLPPWVETPLKVNIGGCPATGHNKWFQFHRNGPGQHGSMCSWNWEDGGDHPTVREVTKPAAFVAQIDTALDDNVQVRIYGYDENGEEVMHDGQKGIVIPAIYGSFLPDPALPKIKTVTRIEKERSIGYVRVFAFEDGSDEKLVAQLRPEEVNASYRRIRVDYMAETIRVLVRKKTYRVSSLVDVIPLCDRNAMIAAMRSKAALDKGDLQTFQLSRQAAISLLEAEQETRNPPIAPSIEIDPTMAPGSIIRI
jgi:hypothetical protein